MSDAIREAPGAPETGGTISRERMALLFVVMLTTAAGNTAMQSVMPSIGTALDVEDWWISLAYSWSALLWVTTAPYWASRSDRRGRKNMMALGMIGFISSFGLCGAILWLGLNGVLGAVATLLLFATARMLYGAFGSAAPPAVQAYVASRTPRAQRTQALSLIASSFGLGTVIGPALAPLLIFPGAGLTGPFIIFAAVATLALVALRLRLPNDDPSYAARGRVVAAPFSASSNPSYREDGEQDEQAAKPDPTEMARMLDDPPKLGWFDTRLRPWLLTGLIGGHAQAMILGIAGFLVLDRLGLRADPDAGAGPIGLVLMAGAIATLLAQWGLIPMFKLGPRSSTLWGMSFALAGTVVIAIAQDLHPIALGFAIASLGFGLYRPGFTAGMSLAVRRSEQGQVSGKVASVNGAAYIVAPALGVYIYGQSSTLAFTLIGLLCVAVFALGWRTLQTDAELTGEGPVD
ncbi:MFS transporter [Qipengyuania sp. JC766]|uniref:MFS transporter n=1 Tax=Qipengyuania sp. JC766 TaxID=3232139 RepID=UPI0034577B7D